MSLSAPRIRSDQEFLDEAGDLAWVIVLRACFDRYYAYLHTCKTDWMHKRERANAIPLLPPKMMREQRVKVQRAAAKVHLALANLDECYQVFEEAIREAYGVKKPEHNA